MGEAEKDGSSSPVNVSRRAQDETAVSGTCVTSTLAYWQEFLVNAVEARIEAVDNGQWTPEREENWQFILASLSMDFRTDIHRMGLSHLLVKGVS